MKTSEQAPIPSRREKEARQAVEGRNNMTTPEQKEVVEERCKDISNK